MLIEIPRTIRRLKQEFIEELYLRFEGEDIWLNMRLQFGEKDEFYEEKTLNTIGIWMSGGADSSMLTYLLAKKIKDEKLNIKIQPLSVRRGRPNNPIYAGNVVDFIENDLDIKMNEHIIYYPDILDEHQREIKEFWDRDDENFREGVFQILYSGITCNPPVDDKTIPLNKERSRDADADRPLKSVNGIRYYLNPFFDIHKKQLAELYKENDLLDTLFPITYSCEGEAEVTKTHTQHCEKCWWCQERFWAFGRYI
jgi:hypothetical protein